MNSSIVNEGIGGLKLTPPSSLQNKQDLILSTDLHNQKLQSSHLGSSNNTSMSYVLTQSIQGYDKKPKNNELQKINSQLTAGFGDTKSDRKEELKKMMKSSHEEKTSFVSDPN